MPDRRSKFEYDLIGRLKFCKIVLAAFTNYREGNCMIIEYTSSYTFRKFIWKEVFGLNLKKKHDLKIDFYSRRQNPAILMTLTFIF